MAKTIVALFDDLIEARKVEKELNGSGFTGDDVIVVQGEEAGRYLQAMEREETPPRQEGTLARAWSRLESIIGRGATRSDVEHYAEGVRRGGTLMIVSTSDEKTDRALKIIEGYKAIDIDERAGEWRKTGWMATEERVAPGAVGSTRETVKGETRIPVAEEELHVGKRAVKHGGIRVHTHVEHTPVQEDVRLREEHVRVERHPTEQRALKPGEEAFKEKTYEFTEEGEEAVVSKRTQVVEEVVVGKDVEERVETVRDTVRRTNVDVEHIGEGRVSAGHTRQATVSAADRADFRHHYDEHYAGSGISYAEYEPAYILGYSLAMEERYRDRDWSDMEPEARLRWEKEHKGRWDAFKDAVHHGWNRAPVLV